MSNIKKTQAAMQNAGLNALLITERLDRLYVLDFHSTDGAVLILRDKVYFVTDSRYIESARERITDAIVIMSTNEKSQNTTLKEILAENSITELGAQDEALSYSTFLSTAEKLEVKLIPSKGIIRGLRETKERYEVDYILAAQRIAEAAFDYVLGLIKPGITERDIAAELDYRMAKNGAEGFSFKTISLAGANGSHPHGAPSNYKLQKGDFVTLDFGCRLGGYCSDMTRTVALGSVSDEMRRVYDIVLNAQLAALDAVRVGMTGTQLDKVARDIITKEGYGEYFGHGLGHGIGLNVHENPRVSPRGVREIPEHAVLTIEPGIYLPGRFGVRIEDMIYLTDSGPENLTNTPKDLIIL